MIGQTRPHITQVSLAWILTLLAMTAPSAAETVQLPGAGGAEIEAEIQLPPGFDPAAAYSVLVSPGDYYWHDRPSQPGWIVVVSGAFWGDGRIENSSRLLAWLRERYEIAGDGFHVVGWSANSGGVFEIAMAHPEQFLSVTGIAGMPARGAEGDVDKLAGLRVQFIVGEHDSYWRQGSERWFELMKRHGIEVTLEIIPGGEHVMPELANEPIFERLNRLLDSPSP